MECMIVTPLDIQSIASQGGNGRWIGARESCGEAQDEYGPI